LVTEVHQESVNPAQWLDSFAVAPVESADLIAVLREAQSGSEFAVVLVRGAFLVLVDASDLLGWKAAAALRSVFEPVPH
jgi:hypothetical protein